jgi:hypothetical protein
VIETTVVNSVVNIAASQEAQSSPAGGDLLPFSGVKHGQSWLPSPRREHETDGTSFERDAESCDAELLALPLRSCLRSGIKLDQCFADQFGIADIRASLAHFK